MTKFMIFAFSGSLSLATHKNYKGEGRKADATVGNKESISLQVGFYMVFIRAWLAGFSQ